MHTHPTPGSTLAPTGSDATGPDPHRLVEPIDLRARIRRLHPIDRERVRTASFTDLLRRQHHDDIAPDVVQSVDHPANDAVAHYLDVPTGFQVHVRKAVLRTVASRRAVTYAESAIVLHRLDEAERGLVLDGGIPLGDVLDVDGLGRELLEWHVGVGAPAPAGRLLSRGLRPGWASVNRTTRVLRWGAPLCLVSEWWPAFDPKATW